MAGGSASRKPANRPLRLAIGLLGSAAFVGLVVYGTLQIPTVECEVCITFRGRSDCRTVAGATATEARSAAVTNVCALMSSGVTDTLACERTPPTKIECSEKD